MEEMEVTFTTNDPTEIKRLSKALDMALFINDLKNEMRKQETIKCEDVYDLLDNYNIVIDDILE